MASKTVKVLAGLRVVAVVGAVAAGAVAQGLEPSARYSHSMAYDSARDRVVLFGGNTNGQWPSGALGETWEWDNYQWTRRNPTNSPSPRGHGGMFYDQTRQRCVYFGGVNTLGSELNETWAWDGNNWIQLAPASSPSPRRHPAISYDSIRQRAVMFGGLGPSGTLGDTWEWDGNNWLPQSSVGISPSARWGTSLAFDAPRAKTVLFSGYGQTSDTWEWNGTVWTQKLTSNAPTARATHAMWFDSSTQRTILFGGSAPNSVDDTWTFDGSNWLQIAPPVSPSPRHWICENGVAFDSLRRKAILFGGYAPITSDTWEFAGNQWKRIILYIRSPVNGHLYATTPPMSWPQAEALAASEGGHLATVRNAQESNWLNQAFGTQTTWIGLSDRAQEGTWQWTSGEPAAFFNWNPGTDPNGGAGENAVAQFPLYGGRWGDWNESNIAVGIIELPGGSSAPLSATSLTTTTPPPALTNHALSPLPSSGAILFGGTTSTGPNFQTYTLTGTTWTAQFPPFSPVTRTGHSLLLDPVRQNNLLFGGLTPGGTPLADTWTWSNNQWNLISTSTAPPARSGHRMAFDRTANLGLLFGGEDATGTALNDFWSWNGTTWAQLTPTTLPPARARHGMAYDDLRNRTIVHGGKSGTTRLNDIWEWDGTNWTEGSAALHPSGRHGTALVHDTARNRLVLHGGRDNAAFLTDTWELSNNPGPLNPGLAWARVNTANAPSPRNSFAMTHDPVRNKSVLFGGYDGSTMVGETWTYDGANWAQQSPATLPPDRSGSGMTFDAARGVAVMFGGFNQTLFQLNDTWEWNGTDWTARTPAASPPGRMFAPLAYDSSRQRTVLFGGLGFGNAQFGDTWEYDGANWTQLAPATSPSPRQLVGLCYDPLRNETVLFGGGTASAVDNETWTWNGATWTQRSPANAPSPRWAAEMAFDPARGKVVLFGGASAGWATNYSDTWEWDGSNWTPTQLRRADGDWNPGARDGHAMAYDPRAERVVLHGGETASGCQQDVWSWNGTEWTIHLAQSGSVPSARTGSQLIHELGGNRMLLFAGGCGTSYTNDLWQLSLPTFARASSYGSPCVGSNGPLTLSVINDSLPVIGQTFQMEMSNVPTFSPCAGYLGFSNTLFNGVPLPFALDFLSMPGCMAYMSANHNFPLPPPNNVLHTTAWNLAIPMDPVFLGLHIYMQGLALELFGGGRFATVTNGVDARIGDR